MKPVLSTPAPEALDIAHIAIEPLIYLGAGTAVLRQIAHPGVGAGVAEHSSTLQQPLSRLQATMAYIYAVSLGSDEDRLAIARHVNRAHVPVHSPSYSAFDPQLQTWVAATLFMGAHEVAQWLWGPLSNPQQTQLLHSARRYGTTLQMPDSSWPAGMEDMQRYWDRQIASFQVSESVRAYAHALLDGGAAPRGLGFLMPLLRQATLAQLEPQLREAFGFAWSPSDAERWRKQLATLVRLYRITPRLLRHAPAHAVLWQFRRKWPASTA